MKIDPLEIIEKVTMYYETDMTTINVRSREWNLRKTRQVCIFFLREFTNLSSGQIGAFFNRDHATVLHAVKTVGNEIDTDKAYSHEITEIRAQLLNCQKNRRGLKVDYFLMGVFGP